jgi:hypothetical protein
MLVRRIVRGIVVLGFVVTLSSTAALAAQSEESCYQLGYRYGKCATQVMLKEECAREDNVMIPDRCKGLEETKEGTKAGAKEVFDAHGLKPKD